MFSGRERSAGVCCSSRLLAWVPHVHHKLGCSLDLSVQMSVISWGVAWIPGVHCNLGYNLDPECPSVHCNPECSAAWLQASNVVRV